MITTTTVSCHKKDESPLYGDGCTHVRLADEGGGTFLEIEQFEEGCGKIRLDKSDVLELIKAVRKLLPLLDS
jgi:hypothetical protein